ncbi:MAG: FG-GAP repeat domain-containing protein, partial [Candidatus Heimdallarchaeaceae archaeon]
MLIVISLGTIPSYNQSLAHAFIIPTTHYSPSNIKLKWMFPTDWFIRSCPSVADVNGDGFLEVLVTSKDRKLYCITHEGNILWSYTTGSSITSSPAVADLDNDGTVEVILGCDDYKVYCVSHEGELEWIYQTRK